MRCIFQYKAVFDYVFTLSISGESSHTLRNRKVQQSYMWCSQFVLYEDIVIVIVIYIVIRSLQNKPFDLIQFSLISPVLGCVFLCQIVFNFVCTLFICGESSLPDLPQVKSKSKSTVPKDKDKADNPSMEKSEAQIEPLEPCATPFFRRGARGRNHQMHRS